MVSVPIGCEMGIRFLVFVQHPFFNLLIAIVPDLILNQKAGFPD